VPRRILLLLFNITHQYCYNYKCLNQGIFSPDRIPHPAAYEIKFLQQWVTVSPSATQELYTDEYQSIIVYVGTNSKASMSLCIVNRYNFIDLSHLKWSWHITSNRSPEPVRSGRLLVPKTGSMEEIPLSLENVISRIRQLERSKTMGVENTYHLNIRGYLRKDTSWATAGHVLVSQQLYIKFEFDEMISTRNPQSDSSKTVWMLESVADDNTIHIFRKNERSRYVLVEVDRISGVIVSYSPNGQNILNDGILPNFVRAAVDNDKGGLTDVAVAPHSIKRLANWLVKESQFSYHSQWINVGLSADKPPDISCLRTRITEASSSERIGIVALCVVRKAKTDIDLFKIKFHYTIYNDGRVRISNHVIPLEPLKRLTTIARIGLSMQVTSPYYNIQYYGRGPHENYPDRKSGSEMGVYVTTPSTMGYQEYVYPVENGSRSDCEWISFRSNDGNGFCIVSTTAEENLSSFSCSALLHSSTEYEIAGHSFDLDCRQNGQHPIHVNIDHQHMGIGGDTRYKMHSHWANQCILWNSNSSLPFFIFFLISQLVSSRLSRISNYTRLGISI
jgi:beta-galactosidase